MTIRPTSTFLFILFGIFAGQTLLAQKLIALHHNGTASFHTTPQAAHDAAVNGDTIYVPGGNFGGLSLQKSLTLVGVGHHPDSTSATGRTNLAALHLYDGSNNSCITGLYITDFIAQGDIWGVLINRCYFVNGIRLLPSNTGMSNWILHENWIGRHPSYGPSLVLHGSFSPVNFIISNNVIEGNIGYNTSLRESQLTNNVFLPNFYLQGSNIIVKNNVFYPNYIANGWLTFASNSEWYNNLNSGVNGGPTSNNHTGSGNYLDNIPLESVFANYAPGNTFYQNDFHVSNPAYLGDDGTPVGIYGGQFPWKEGGLPFNPHIRSKAISSTTNPDGTLQINIVVKAQGN
ncbi:MAG: hypothetical protein JNJ90_06930 [Saprospiraceae bacterium]|nr:hypothetical protein [Saprospiraceae bacterium]